MSSSIVRIVAALAALALVACVVAANTLQRQVANDPLAIGQDGSLYLGGIECGPNEELVAGSLPTCEPTCKNPRPICPKVFYSGLDFVPCFCKKPLVRNEETKQCVTLDKCPK